MGWNVVPLTKGDPVTAAAWNECGAAYMERYYAAHGSYPSGPPWTATPPASPGSAVYLRPGLIHGQSTLEMLLGLHELALDNYYLGPGPNTGPRWNSLYSGSVIVAQYPFALMPNNIYEAAFGAGILTVPWLYEEGMPPWQFQVGGQTYNPGDVLADAAMITGFYPTLTVVRSTFTASSYHRYPFYPFGRYQITPLPPLAWWFNTIYGLVNQLVYVRRPVSPYDVYAPSFEYHA